MPSTKETADAFRRATDAARDLRWIEVEAEIEASPSLAHYRDEFKSTLLIELAGIPCSAPLLRRLVDLGADPNARCDDGTTALTTAVLGGTKFGLTTLSELRLLVELGADPNLHAESGLTPLQWAIAQNRLEHAELLLALGADPYRRSIDYEPETAFDVAKRCYATEAQALLRRWEAARNEPRNHRE
jgi:ankyrin repeat protein